MDPLIARRKYMNTLCMIYIEALNKILDQPKVLIDFSVNNGIYTEIRGLDLSDEDLLARLKLEMKALVADDLIIHKSVVPKDQAIEIFQAQGFDDKVKVLSNSLVVELPIYRLQDLSYYFVGGVLNSTGQVASFDLYPFHKGIVLVHPNGKLPKPDDQHASQELAYINQEKLFDVFQESEDWTRLMGVNHAGDLNQIISEEKIQEIVLITEALHEKRIAQIADEIGQQSHLRVIFIAGPSSSGKTTFANRLGIQLRVLGKHFHVLGLDDYFLNRDMTPLDEKGEKNFDSLSAIDLDLFSSNLKDLLAGQEVLLPSYNFITGKREYRGEPVRLPEDTYIIVEGIHGLNEKVTSLVDAETKFKIYISALTQLNIDNHNRIPTTDLRLIRRIVRDDARRGYDAEATMAMWKNVVDGENINIFPFQENADVMFNSSLLYELSILRKHAIPILKKVPESSPYFKEAKRLLRFLAFFRDCSCERYVANSSILREFIGGSCFSD